MNYSIGEANGLAEQHPKKIQALKGRNNFFNRHDVFRFFGINNHHAKNVLGLFRPA